MKGRSRRASLQRRWPFTSQSFVSFRRCNLQQLQHTFVRSTSAVANAVRAYPDPTGTYIEHVDCWAKLLDNSTMLVAAVPESHPLCESDWHSHLFGLSFRQRTAKAAVHAVPEYEAAAEHYAEWYQIVRVAVGASTEPFTNSLIVNDRVYVPVRGTVLDEPALETYAEAMGRAYTIVGVAAVPSNPWESTDALHCRTKGVPLLTATKSRRRHGGT